jgi:putative hydrolase of the HAD superfamily
VTIPRAAVIKSFIFDIGNVLLPFDFTVAIRRLEPLCGTPVAGAMQVCRPLIDACETGELGRADFLRRITAVLKFSGTDEELAGIWQDIFTENAAMTELVRSLHGRYPLHLLSNTSEIHVDHFTRAYPVFCCFSGAVYSHEAKCMKPGREIYEIAMQKFGVNPVETVFIDDLPANVQAARELGFEAIQYDLTRHGEFLEALKAAGVEGVDRVIPCAMGK